MYKYTLQFLFVFSLGIILGLFIKFSITFFIALAAILVSLFIYTMRDMPGLKHNQDKYFIAVSSLAYLAALGISLYSTTALILFVLYEISKKSNFRSMLIRMLPHIIITIISIFLFRVK